MTVMNLENFLAACLDGDIKKVKSLAHPELKHYTRIHVSVLSVKNNDNIANYLLTPTPAPSDSSEEMVKLLVSRDDTDLSIRNNAGETAKDLAKRLGRHKIVKIIEDAERNRREKAVDKAIV